MNFEFSEEQNLLREQARSFLNEQCPPMEVRKILEGDEPFDRNLWRAMAELGWMGATIPADYGGIGLSYYELGLIAEELGRACAPVPFSSSVYLATEAILLAGSEQQKQKWLPRLASGECIGSFALAEGEGRPTEQSVKATVTKNRIRGEKYPIVDGDVADFVIVVANDTDSQKASLYIVETADVERRTVETIDPTRSHGWLRMDDTPGDRLGGNGQGWALTQRLLDRAAVLYAWEQVGGSDAALHQARDYAMDRYAFGRPIASLQAIKHKLAHAFVNNTLARSNCYYGLWALANDAPDLPLAAATARVSAIQAYYYASKENIQTHGGMGFAWEFDCQFHYRRAKLLALNIGSESWWQDRLVTAFDQTNVA